MTPFPSVSNWVILITALLLPIGNKAMGDSPPNKKLNAKLSNLAVKEIEQARANYAQVCPNKTQTECDVIATETAKLEFGGKSMPRSRLLALGLCSQGQMEGKDPCEWYCILEKNPSLKVPVMEALCEENNPQACVASVSSICGSKLASKNPGKVLALLKKHCDAGYGKACSRAGEMLIQKDRFEANQLFTKGCDFNDAWSCILLSAQYQEAGDLERVKQLKDKACQIDPLRSCKY